MDEQMRLIKGGKKLSTTIGKLTEKHENVSFAVAWASSDTEAFNAISLHRSKIQNSVIGTHFYQTHPDVLDEFIGFEECRFIMQPQGVFHPKVYLFWSSSSWDLIIGSANLTKGAFSKNSELLIHITSKDSDEELRLQTENTIREYWEDGEVVTSTQAIAYRSLWKSQQELLNRISGNYGSPNKNKSPVNTKVMAMPWTQFLEEVKADPHHGFEERCELLDLVREKFLNHNSFWDMELGIRKTIAGLPNDWNEHWAWFGSMRGAGYYHQAINNNDVHIAKAVDLIPMNGVVSRIEYSAFIDSFVKAFPNGRDGIGIASRLLALKRPDQFVCLDSRNKTQLCKDFGIKQSDMDYDRYWDDVICRIMDSVWWNCPMPLNEQDKIVWTSRAALLDAIFYEP